VIDAVAEAPGGTHPSYTAGYSDRDNAAYVAWDAISRDRDTFVDWVEEHIMHSASAVPS
jgi:glutaconate CoA-transferase subunit A